MNLSPEYTIFLSSSIALAKFSRKHDVLHTASTFILMLTLMPPLAWMSCLPCLKYHPSYPHPLALLYVAHQEKKILDQIFRGVEIHQR